MKLKGSTYLLTEELQSMRNIDQCKKTQLNNLLISKQNIHIKDGNMSTRKRRDKRREPRVRTGVNGNQFTMSSLGGSARRKSNLNTPSFEDSTPRF